MYFRMVPPFAGVVANPSLAKSRRTHDSGGWSNGQLAEAQALQPGLMVSVRETSASRWPARDGPHGGSGPAHGTGRPFRLALLALFAVGGGLGLWLWGKWGFLIAFDTIRAYCF
jgi:hypothetical protein